MTPTSTSGTTASPVRIGIPWRTTKEQREGERKKLDYYFEAVNEGGGRAVRYSAGSDACSDSKRSCPTSMASSCRAAPPTSSQASMALVSIEKQMT